MEYILNIGKTSYKITEDEVKGMDKYVSTIELYKNPFKYLNPLEYSFFGNLIDTQISGYNFNPKFYGLFNKPKSSGENILGLGHLQLYYRFKPFDDYNSYLLEQCSMVTGLYLPENFSMFKISFPCYMDDGDYILKFNNLVRWNEYIIKNPKITPKKDDSLISWDKIIQNNNMYNIQNLLEKQMDINDLLKLSRETITERHCYGSPKIYMDGRRYIRIEPFKPYLPRGFLGGLYINSYTPLDLYVEFMYNNRCVSSYEYSYNYVPVKDIFPDITSCINTDICQRVSTNDLGKIMDNDMLRDDIKSLKLLKNEIVH